MAATGDDCYFFYYSTCTKGATCPYRHCEAARGNEVTCINWKQGFCYRPNCAFRHMEITKNRSEIPCYWESQPLGCQKLHCPFKHINRPSGVGNTTSSASVSPSLINKLPTITGPVTKPLPPVATQPSANVPQSVPSLSKVEGQVNVPEVKPVVVHPTDSEDDESMGTLSTDGSPGKKLLLSPPRPSNKLGLNPSMVSRISPLRLPIKPAVKPAPAEKTLSFGIKTLDQIRREKDAERGHIKEEEVEDAEEEEGMEEDEEEEEERKEEFGEYPLMSRRIISVSGTGARKINLRGKEEQRARRPPGIKEKMEVKGLAQIREDQLKRLADSADIEGGEKGNVKKRLKVFHPEAVGDDEFGGEEPQKKIVRRIMIGGGAQGGKGVEKGRTKETDTTGLDSIKIKTVAEIRMEKLKQRLGNQVVNKEVTEDNSSSDESSAGRKRTLASRLGKITRTSEEGGANTDDSSGVKLKKVSLASRLGNVLRAVKDDDVSGLSSVQASHAVKKVGLISRRVKVMRDDGGSGDNPSAGIKIKSLEEIKREKLLKRLGKPLPGSAGESLKIVGKEKDASSQDEDGEEEEEAEEEEKEEEVEEEEEKLSPKKGSGDIRIKTLAEIRQEKQSRVVRPGSSQSDDDTDRENGRGAQKKGAQSATERRSRKRVEMALYKPPSMVRGLKENQGQLTGLRRNIEISEDKEKVEERPAMKMRRLNLSRSVENANKGTDSVLTVIKQRTEGSEVDSGQIKVKSLAEIRAEKQQRPSLIPGAAKEEEQEEDKEEMMEKKEDEEEEEEEEKKKIEERRQERRANIWSRSLIDTKPEKLTVKVVAGEGGKKSLDQIRRERRAKLWNTTPSGDASSKPIIKRHGGSVIATDAASSEIKIKTLAEIRREKQLREQSRADQVSDQTPKEPVEEESRGACTAAVQEIESGDPIPSVHPGSSDETGESSEEHAPVSQLARGASSSQRTKIARNPMRGKRGRQGSSTSQGNQQTSTNSSTSEVQSVQSETRVPPSSSSSSSSSSVLVSQTVLNTTVEDSRHIAPSKVQQPDEAEVSRSIHPASNANQEVAESSSIADVHIPAAKVSSEPDSATAINSDAKDMVSQARPITKRLTSVTDEDLQRFLAENDDDDLDSLPVANTATQDEDDDLLNELDDFLNS